MVPTSEEIVTSYEQMGGQITHFPVFGRDPLSTNLQMIHERERRFNSNNVNWELMFGKIVNNDDTDFCAAIMTYLNITRELSNELLNV